MEKFRHIAEVAINAGGLVVNGAEETGDMYSAIDLVADNIEGQIRRNKDRNRRRKPGGGIKRLPSETGEGGSREPEIEPRVIRIERYFAKPMDVEEAVMELRLSSEDFIVFTNRDSGAVNVLFHRKDGHYGLVESG